MTQKTAIIVLGMHRSGTSSVAGVLSRLGAAAPRTPMEVAADNPRGFFESRLIGELDDRILEAGGSWWSDWRQFDPGVIASDVLADFRREIAATVEAEFGDAATIVLKDPRLCRLWPVWDGVLETAGYRIVHVLPLRSPLEVAGSLKTRNDMPIAQGLALWLRHVLDAEKFSRGAERRLIRWTAFMTDWRAGAATIAEMLSPGAFSLDRAAEIDAYLSRDLRHEVVPDETLARAAETHAWAVEAYGCLTAAADGDGAAAALKRLDQLRDRFDAASDLFGRATAAAIAPARSEPESRHATFESSGAQTDVDARLAAAEARHAQALKSLEGLKTLLNQERAMRGNESADHAEALRSLEVAVAAERERREALEERLRLSMRSLVEREVRLSRTSAHQ
ncbi:MAG: sulfotransferase family protein [Brevundimonas sp.]|uniref:sulfotransferase family protein n=1 Tax=Brevundimonas sp. TaxID=1871086 RepID=UPI004033B7D2